MIKVWSDVPGARRKELVGDVATVVWVVFWGNIVWQLFEFLSSFAEAGRTVPVVGSQVRDIARDTFGGAGRPLSAFGTELEQFIFVIAVVLALLLALVTLEPWLVRYLRWRWGRLQTLRAADRAIRKAPGFTHTDIADAGGPGGPGDAGGDPAGLRDASRVHAVSAR